MRCTLSALLSLTHAHPWLSICQRTYFFGATSCVCCILAHKLDENRPPRMRSNGVEWSLSVTQSHHGTASWLRVVYDVVIEPLLWGKDEVEFSSLDVIEIACVSLGRKCVSPHKLNDKRFGFKFLYLWTLNTANGRTLYLWSKRQRC